MSVALVTLPVSERGGEGSRIAGRDQLAGAGAIGGGAERFGHGHAVGLRAGRRDEQVGGGVRVAERRADQDADEPDAVAVPEARDTGLQLFDEVRVAVERSGQHAMPVPLSEVGERLDEEVLPLVAAEDSAPAKPTTSQPTADQEKVSATLTVAAPASRVFAVLADPTTHAAIDGTGWVQESADRAPLTEAGQIFRMDMHHPAIQTVTTRWSIRSGCSTRRAPSAG